MSGPEDKLPEDGVIRDDPMIAAEWALGLLEGEELLAARGKYASDPAFAWRKEWWDGWFAPLSDDIAGAEPGSHVWQAIAARIAVPDAGPHAASDQVTVAAGEASNIVSLERKLRRWQWVAGLTSAAAALAFALLAFAPGNAPGPLPAGQPTPAPALAAADPLVATVPIGDTGLRLDVTYIPESERMLIAAIGLTADGVHDHELWLVPQGGGAPTSLGVVTPGMVRAMEVPAAITAELHDGSRLVLTREPLGGKPADAEAGPVVAEGAFTRV